MRVGQTVASGLVTAQGTGGTTLTLNLSQLGGRSAAAFDFAGTGSTTTSDATAAAYIVNKPAAVKVVAASASSRHKPSRHGSAL